MSAKISATADARAIYTTSSGTINISGGNISAESYQAIYSLESAAINISGGTISSKSFAISCFDTITISQAPGATTLITSAADSSSYGTIHLGTNGRLIMIGGKVENTSSGSAVYNREGTIDILGGTLKNTSTGKAIHNAGTGKITIGEDDAINNPTLITSAYSNSLTSGGTILS